MKVKIAKEKCIGCGLCESLCPKIFEMKGDKAVVKTSNTNEKCAIESKDACPTQAIEVK